MLDEINQRWGRDVPLSVPSDSALAMRRDRQAYLTAIILYSKIARSSTHQNQQDGQATDGRREIA